MTHGITWHRRAAAGLLLLLCLAGTVPLNASRQGQSRRNQKHEFDAVSIKRNRTGAEASDTNTTPGRLSFINVTPLSLIRRAFGVDDAQIVGAPGWASSERYDIVAVTAGGEMLGDQERQPLLQALLADRWHLGFHRETRDLRVFSLVPGKSGAHMATHLGPGDYAMRVERAPDGRLTLRCTRGNMTRLAEILSRQTGATVTNETGLSGEYDFVLTWASDESATTSGPSLVTALQEQLGLKLEAAKRPVTAIVIDRMERPTEN